MNAVATKSKLPSLLGVSGMAGLDTQMLATTSPQLSPDKARRESLHDNSGAFSPHDASWSGYHFNLDSSAPDTTNTGMHSFFNASNGAVMAQNTAAQSASFSPQSGWPTTDTSGSCTPTPAFDQVLFPSQQSPADPVQGFNPVQLHNPQQMSSAAAVAAGFPAASSPTKDSWFRMNEGMDFQQLPTHKSPHPPQFASSTHILRRDGIRKKNARFEIPAERNLRTIDQLINQSTDDQEIKELKQQKRLLRNRQAALDSRQRKKQHTERLEEEKKQYTSVISDLEEALNESRNREATLMRERETWVHAQQQYNQYIEQLSMEKDELVRRHTIETGELRKKYAVLSDQMQRMDSTATSTAPSSAGFSTDFSEFEHLTMNSWDEFSMGNEFNIEHDAHTEVPAPLHPSSVTAKKEQQAQQHAKLTVPVEDKGITSGVLLMLLLCGAWVVSNGPKSSADVLPAVSDEMKSASAAVLDNLYRDSGIHLGPNLDQHSTAIRTSAMGDIEMSGGGNNMHHSSLDNLHHRLVQPTQQQLQDQAFSLTPTQYNEINSGITPFHPVASSYETGNSRTVGEVLATDTGSRDGANSGPAGNGNMADSYTRSVLKGRVSSQVLKEFARMVTAKKHSSSSTRIKPDSID